jgi:hypothetical protein
MRDEILNQEDPRLQPISALMQLAEHHGNLQLISSLTHLFAIEVEEDRCCVSCQRKAVWMLERLVQLMDDFEKEFPPAPAVTKVNHPGLIGIVQ